MKEKVLKFSYDNKGNLDIAGFVVPKNMLSQFTCFLSEVVYPGYIIRYVEKS